TNCESLQEEGKFCAKCGSETIDVNKEEPTNEEQTDDSHADTQAEPAKEATEKASNNVNPAHQEGVAVEAQVNNPRSEEHTSELQSRFDLVCRLLLEKKKKQQTM